MLSVPDRLAIQIEASVVAEKSCLAGLCWPVITNALTEERAVHDVVLPPAKNLPFTTIALCTSSFTLIPL